MPDKKKYQYIDVKQFTTINEYNDIMALWIKMENKSRQLDNIIENFELNEHIVWVNRQDVKLFENEETEAWNRIYREHWSKGG